ncbi:MAG: IS5 family transposase [Dehalococcoidia bacterium]|nr:IS5 family transposase [Dehalococcoidia bacterium]
MNKQKYLFGADTQLEKVTVLGDPLVKIKNCINWEMFRQPIESAIRKDISKGGRPPFDVIQMFKITMLQQWYGLSDMALEYQINDRVSFCRFLDLEFGDKVPDGNTIWDFKESLRKDGLDRKLFDSFNAELEKQGIITRKGTIVDATFVTVAKRHTTKADDERLKAGEEPSDLADKNVQRLKEGKIKHVENVTAQIDMDARWTKKGNESYFGFKNHVKCDKDSKVITGFTVSDAAVHDSQEFVGLIDKKDKEVSADSGYIGKDIHKEIKVRNPSLKLHICARAYRNTPLSEENKAHNRGIARSRARIEHIFGYMTRFMGGLNSRVHGLERVTRDITAKNMAYNLKRYVHLRG